MSNIGSSQIIVQTFITIWDYFLLVKIFFVFSLCKKFLQICWVKQFNKWKVFFFLSKSINYLIISSWFPWINEYWRTYYWANNILWILTNVFIAKNNNKQMKLGTFIVIRSWAKSKAIERSTSILQLNIIFSLDSNILQI